MAKIKLPDEEITRRVKKHNLKKVKLTDAELTARAKKYNLIKDLEFFRYVADTVDKEQGVYKEVRKRAKELEKEGGA